MRGLILASLGTATSVACAFTALGVALYGGSGDAAAAALLYGGFGLAAGAVCSALDLAWHRLPNRVRGEDAGRPPGLATAEAAFRPSRFGA